MLAHSLFIIVCSPARVFLACLPTCLPLRAKQLEITTIIQNMRKSISRRIPNRQSFIHLQSMKTRIHRNTRITSTEPLNDLAVVSFVQKFWLSRNVNEPCSSSQCWRWPRGDVRNMTYVLRMQPKRGPCSRAGRVAVDFNFEKL